MNQRDPIHFLRWTEQAAILGTRVEVSRKTDRKVNSYASHSNLHSLDSSGCPALAGQPFHPDGGKYQINFERTRGHLRGVVAPQCIWTVPLALAYSRWDLGTCG